MASEESLSEAFHANPAPMVVSDPTTGRIVDVNAQWVKLIGYGREEQIGHLSGDLGIWEDVRVRERVVSELRRKGSVRAMPARVRAKNGEIREVLWSAETIARDGDQVMLSLIYDITERRRAEEALRASEERFKRLLQNSNDIVSLFDEQGRRTFLAGPCERILGYASHELVGAGAFDHVHPDDRPVAEATFIGGLAIPGEVRRAEYRFRHKNGSWILMESIGANLLHDPIVHGVVLNSRDITERARLQEQLQQAMKMEAVGRLAGGVAHDFNNLLTAISGNVELARLEHSESRPIDEYLAEIRRATKSAASLTRQLLSFSHRQIIEPKTIDLGDLIEETKTMLARLLGEDVDLQVDLDRGLEPGLARGPAQVARVRIDPGQFEQVLVNLAVNARDAMPEGGRLRVQTRKVELGPGGAGPQTQVAPGRYLLLSVSDTGHGMSPEVKQRIFEPFFTTKPKGTGTGLGLATTFGIVKQAGGHIEVDSEEGRGTTFRIYLPRVEEASPSATEPAVHRDLAGKETILLVEDDVSVRGLTFRMLTRMGYRVLQARDGEEALSILDGHAGDIELLLTDVVMPGINGRDLAERVLGRRPQTKVLFTSGYNEDVVLHHGIVDRHVNFIGKPYTMQALGQKLRDVIEGGT